jgi:hypothetical protein
MVPLSRLYERLRRAEQVIKDKLKYRRLSHRPKISMNAMIFLRVLANVKRQLVIVRIIGRADYFQADRLHRC